MIPTAKLFAVSVASSLVVLAPPPVAGPMLSAETLRLLDPGTLLAGACGQKRTHGAALRQRLQLAMASSQAAAAISPATPPALMTGLGDVHFKISTSNPQAQRYFDQGLALSYGFNHAEAIRAFRHAQTLDPQCAMCWWGEAFAHGPNINAPMDPTVVARAVETTQKAMERKASAMAHEQALIEAMAKRYVNDPKADRPALDKAFAAAMLDVAARYPKDDDIAVLAAESVMDTQPWDYWEADARTPKGQIGRAIKLVEGVLARNPDHPQANHLYIHLMEASAMPQKAERYADRLAKPLMPASGHLLHMPGHLYYRLGRYRDAIRVNVDAARTDEAYLKASNEAGLYRFGYYPHNIHFIVTSAQMAGDMRTALTEAKKLGTVLNTDITASMPWVQPVDAAPYLAYAQFASPAEILALPAPDKRLPYVTGMWHYARAVAYAQSRNMRGFEQELAALRRIRETTDFKPMVDQLVPAPDLLRLAEEAARGRLAYAQGRYQRAAGHYRKAAAIEDTIRYMEPPFWYYPVRQSLGAALYRAGDLPGAKQAFMNTLATSPNNAWALYGLARTQRTMGDAAGAQATTAAFKRAWLGDDRWLTLDRL